MPFSRRSRPMPRGRDPAMTTGADAANVLDEAGPVIQRPVIAAAVAVLVTVAGAAVAAGGVRLGLLTLIGFAAGLALYHASFGFTSAWRRMLAERRGLGLRAQLIMIGLTAAVFFPLLGQGSFGGQPVTGFVSPVGVALCVGAFLFGVGMQLGGGCGSGTLYTAGGGNTRMAVTLLAFVSGSLIATADPLGWSRWPDIGAYSLVEAMGAPAALAAGIPLLGAVYLLVLRLERRWHGAVQPLSWSWSGDLLRGPWPVVAGALALALVNVATLVVAGRPWGITSAFALWGAKAAAGAGLDVGNWPYWQGDSALTTNVLADVTSVMDFGVMLGALTAAGLAGRFAPRIRVPLPSLVAAILGGLLMGIGARLATGCNIGAFFSGAASGSAHGIVWLVFAIPGNWVGMRLRPLFQMGGQGGTEAGTSQSPPGVVRGPSEPWR